MANDDVLIEDITHQEDDDVAVNDQPPNTICKSNPDASTVITVPGHDNANQKSVITPEFDEIFLQKNADLLRRLRDQQARDEALLGLRTNLFSGEGSVSVANKMAGTPAQFVPSTMVHDKPFQTPQGLVIPPGYSGPLPSNLHKSGRGPKGDEVMIPYRPKFMSSHSKFTPRIADAPLPPKLRMPTTIGKYDGTTDPDDHMFDFGCAAEVELWPDQAWIKHGSGVASTLPPLIFSSHDSTHIL